LKHKLKGHTDGVQSVAFSPEGTTLASGGSDSTIRIWNVQTGELLRTIKGQTYTVGWLAFSPAGAQRTLIASGGGLTASPFGMPQAAKRYSGSPRTRPTMSMRWPLLPIGGAATATDNLLKIWDVKTGALLQALEHGSADYAEIDTIGFSPDGSLVVSADDRAVKMWDAATGTLRLTINDPMPSLTTMTFAPNGSALAIGGGAIKLLDLERGVAVKR
jgi:WD40 repeat protein